MIGKFLLAYVLTFSQGPTTVAPNTTVASKTTISGASATVTWTHPQTTAFQSASSTPTNVVLGSNPTVGNVVEVGVYVFNPTAARTVSSLVDGSSNSYTCSASSPNNDLFTTAGQVWLCYFIATGTPNKTITLTLSGTVNRVVLYADEFHKSSGTVTLDSDAKCTSSSAQNSNTTVCTFTPAIVGELVYVIGAVDTSNITGAGTGWTQNDHGPDTTDGSDTEYQLSAGATAAVAFVWTSGTNKVAVIILAFK